MKKYKIKTILLSMLLFISIVNNNSYSKNRPFKRSMIMSGGNINFLPFIGQYDAAVELDLAPDLIIASCGGSIAAAIINAIPNQWERLEFLKSLEFYSFLNNIKMTDVPVDVILDRVLKMIIISRIQSSPIYKNKKNKYIRKIPDFFSFSLIDKGNDFVLNKLLTDFKSEKRPSLIIVASELNFYSDDVGKIIPFSKKLYKEVYFTDFNTAKFLKDWPSDVAIHFPNSFIEKKTKVITGIDLMTAVRASIADPNLLPPLEINNKYYVTGAINLFPIDLANRLSDNIIAKRGKTWDRFVEIPTIQSFFGFNPQFQRQRKYKEKIEYWVDYSDPNFSSMLIDFEMIFEHKDQFRFVKLLNGVPDSYLQYLEYFEQQYGFGYQQMEKSIKSK